MKSQHAVVIEAKRPRIRSEIDKKIRQDIWGVAVSCVLTYGIVVLVYRRLVPAERETANV